MTKDIAMNTENYRQKSREDQETFIQNLIFLRETRKWSQAQMWQKIGHGLKFKTYQSWEEKRAFPPIFFARTIAQILKQDLTDMLTQNLVKEAA